MPIPNILCFVCTNERPGGRESCGGTHQSAEFLQALRDELKKRGLRPAIRATRSGCLGRCRQGPFALVVPGMDWLAEFELQDVGKVADQLEEALS